LLGRAAPSRGQVAQQINQQSTPRSSVHRDCHRATVTLVGPALPPVSLEDQHTVLVFEFPIAVFARAGEFVQHIYNYVPRGTESEPSPEWKWKYSTSNGVPWWLRLLKQTRRYIVVFECVSADYSSEFWLTMSVCFLLEPSISTISSSSTSVSLTVVANTVYLFRTHGQQWWLGSPRNIGKWTFQILVRFIIC